MILVSDDLKEYSTLCDRILSTKQGGVTKSISAGAAQRGAENVNHSSSGKQGLRGAWAARNDPATPTWEAVGQLPRAWT